MAVASTPLVAAPSCPAWAKRRRTRIPAAVRRRAVRACRGRGRVAVPSRRPRAQHGRAEAPGDRCTDALRSPSRREQARSAGARPAPAAACSARPARGAGGRQDCAPRASRGCCRGLQPEPDDVKIIFGSQARIPPGAAHPRHTHPTLRIPGHDALQQPSEPQWCLRELTRCAALVLRAPRPRSFVSTTTPCSVRGEKR